MTTVRDLVGRQERVVFVEPGATVREAAKAMAQSNVGCTAVLEDGRLLGLFTERDVLKRILLKDLNVDEVRVSEVMTREIVTCGPKTDVRSIKLPANCQTTRPARPQADADKRDGTRISTPLTQTAMARQNRRNLGLSRRSGRIPGRIVAISPDDSVKNR